MPRWTAVTTRIPKPKLASPGYIVTDGRSIWVEEQHPSWWNTKDRRGKEYHGPVVTHWMPLPQMPMRKATDRGGKA